MFLKYYHGFFTLDELIKIAVVYIDLVSKIEQTIVEDFFLFVCGDLSKMATVHQGAFAAKKMREREEKINASLNPMKYNTKFMDSIWGQYNRYSVHNLKKIMNEEINSFLVTPAEKFIPKKNEQIFSAGGFGSSNPFASKRVYN